MHADMEHQYQYNINNHYINNRIIYEYRLSAINHTNLRSVSGEHRTQQINMNAVDQHSVVFN